MKIVHIDELPVQSRQPRGREGKSVKTSIIMQGDPSRLDNFNFRILYDEAGDIYSPRHHHNFCQFYYMLDGDYDFGQTGHAKQGWLVYVPEGAYYGPQSGTPHTRIAVQFGGPSGSGFLEPRQHTQAFEELKQLGVFEKGIFKRHADVPGRRTQDSYEAIWEHVRQRPIGYAEPQYANPIFMNPAGFPWEPVDGSAGTDQKVLGILSSARLKAASYRLQPGATFSASGRGMYTVLSGTGSVTGNGYRKLSTVYLEDGEEATFTAAELTEMVQFGLPTLDQISKQPPAPRVEEPSENTYATA
jgi:hypothetical protein